MSKKLIVSFLSTTLLLGLASSVRAQDVPEECQSNYEPGSELHNDKGVVKPPWELPGAFLAEAWYFILGDVKACD